MVKKNQNKQDTIFVDCFSTIIFRKIKRKEVFKQWAKELSTQFNIDWKTIYRLYMNTNFNLSFKKLFTTFTLQEEFGVVLKKVFSKLVKKYTWLSQKDFHDKAIDIYVEKEKACFSVNQELIDFLLSEKQNGKKIYLVSDFYCKSDIFSKWFRHFKIEHVFDKIFSSCDFNKEKATTKLYKHLIKELQLDPKNVTMYGDNLWSDILMAKSCGLHAKRIKRKHKGENYAKSK